jgi:hypothetical protein
MRFVPVVAALSAALLAGPVLAKLPPPSDEAKAKAAEAAAKSGWSAKVDAYKLCQAMDRVADNYRKHAKAAGKEASAPAANGACVDPGPFATTPVAAKPLEASGAHSPPGNATSPPSTNTPDAQMPKGAKK